MGSASGYIYEQLFNIIFETGIVPDNWLMGYIKPIYKNKGDKMDPKKYRPITILSCLPKTISPNFVESFLKFNKGTKHFVLLVFENFKKVKSTNKLSPKKYRPITILSCFGKLFTAVLSERLTKYSDDFVYSK
jgi:hypothetical protein